MTSDNFNVADVIANASSLAENDPAAALAVFNDALASDENIAALRVARAALFLKSEEFDKALSDIEAATILEPKNARYQFELGHIYEKRNSYSAAYTSYMKASVLSPEESRYPFRAGLMAERTGNPIRAVHSYELAVSLPRPPIRYWFFLGRALEKRGDWAGAASAYEMYSQRMSARGESPSTLDGGLLDFRRQMRFGTVTKPEYAYGVYRACLLAQKLGVPKIAVIELGVAGGHGLLALEEHSATATRLTGVDVAVYGFDTGVGLPPPVDYRDLPHYFVGGDYSMDAEALRSRLQTAELRLGDAADSTRELLSVGTVPIGALFFDMDLYSSTSRVLELLGDSALDERFLPRVGVYFDDLVAKKPTQWLKDYGDYTGEALAISEYNSANTTTKLSTDRYFGGVPENYAWHQCMYLLNRFTHPEFNSPVMPPRPETLRLTEKDLPSAPQPTKNRTKNRFWKANRDN